MRRHRLLSLIPGLAASALFAWGTGDGVRASGLTVNLVHVVLQDALTGVRTGEIIVGSATTSAAM